MDIDEKLLQKLNKLYTLAERGCDNEKDIAEKKLNKLLSDNNLTLNDILQSDKPQLEEFKFKNEYDRKILLQCIYKVIGDNLERDHNVYTWPRVRTKLGVYCTKAEKVEMLLEYGFYSKYLHQELLSYINSFIQANKIFPRNGKVEEIDPDNIDENTLKILQMSNMIKHKTRQLQIEDKGEK